MSTHFLARLVHRALSAPDVRPRIAARFEPAGPLDRHAERVIEPTPAPVVPVERGLATGEEAERDERRAPLPDPPFHEVRHVHTQTNSREAVVERVVQREAPVPLETPARVESPRTEAAPPPQRIAPALPLLLEPRRETANVAPLPARTEFVAAPPEPRNDARAEAPTVPRTPSVATPPTPLLAPAVSPPAAPIVNTRVAPEPAPAPIEIVIGRIEIRSDPPAPSRGAKPAPGRAAMSLDDYLRGRGKR